MPNTSNWWIPSQPYNGQPGAPTYGGGGSYKSDVVQYRSTLDAARAGHGQAPFAQYPDGYLGTLSQDRRQDKLLQHITEKLTERSYQRGVHKGEKISSSDYYWPKGAEPDRGLKRQARYVRTRNTMLTERYSPRGNPVERLAHLGKTAGLSAPEEQNIYKQYGVSMAKNPIVVSDPDAKARMQKMRPLWV